MHSYRNYEFSFVIVDIAPTLGTKRKYAAKLHVLLDTKTKQWLVRNGERPPVGERRSRIKQEAEAKLEQAVHDWIDKQNKG